MSPAHGFGFDYLFAENNERKLESLRQNKKIKQQDIKFQRQEKEIVVMRNQIQAIIQVLMNQFRETRK